MASAPAPVAQHTTTSPGTYTYRDPLSGSSKSINSNQIANMILHENWSGLGDQLASVGSAVGAGLITSLGLAGPFGIVAAGVAIGLRSVLSHFVADYDGWFTGQVLPKVKGVAQHLPTLTPVHPTHEMAVTVSVAALSTSNSNSLKVTTFALTYPQKIRVDWGMWAHNVFLGIGSIGSSLRIFGPGGNAVFNPDIEGPSAIGGTSGTTAPPAGSWANSPAYISLPAGWYVAMAAAGSDSDASMKITLGVPTGTHKTPATVHPGGSIGSPVLIAGLAAAFLLLHKKK